MSPIREIHHRGRTLDPGSIAGLQQEFLVRRKSTVLAKLTSKNPLTLPRSVTQAIGPVEYFNVEARDGQIVLTPVRIQRGDAVRAKLAEMGLDEQDVVDAVAWARAPLAPAAAGMRTQAARRRG